MFVRKQVSFANVTWRGAVAIKRGVSSGQERIGSCGATEDGEQQGRYQTSVS